MRKENKWKKWFLVFAFTMMLGFIWKTDSFAAEKAGNIIVSVEKFTIGQGYLIDPTITPFYKGEHFSDVLLRVLRENGYEANVKNSEMGFYLALIYNADNGKYEVPDCIKSMPNMTTANGEGLKCPTGNEKNKDAPKLGEFSYMPSSGWLYSKNGEFPNYVMSDCEMSDGDVIRVQFTLYGYGADLGDSNESMKNALNLPKREEITKRLALISQNRAACFLNDDCRKAYGDAYDAVIDLDTLQEKMDMVYNALPSEEAIKDYVVSYNEKLVQDLMTRIKKIGEVTLEKERDIIGIRNTYNSFNDEQKSKVSPESLEILTNAEKVIVQLKNEQKADSVISQINALGTVSLSNESQVVAARKAYNALTTEQKALVSAEILSKLTQAEQNISQLKAQVAAEKAATEQKAEQEAQQKALQQALINQNTPAKTTLKSVKKIGTKKAKLTWKKVNVASGYEIYMSMKKSSGYKKIKTIKKAKTVTFTKSGLKKKQTYYFKVRTYRIVNGVTYYGNDSNVKKVNIK